MKILLTLLVVIIGFSCGPKEDPIQKEKKKVFYRIKSIDKDGTVRYSDYIRVTEEVE